MIYYKMRSFHGRFLNQVMTAVERKREWKIKDGMSTTTTTTTKCHRRWKRYADRAVVLRRPFHLLKWIP